MTDIEFRSDMRVGYADPPSGERWAALPSNARYEVSDWGRIRNAATGAVKRCPIGVRGGYPMAQLWTGERNLSRPIHALVMESFEGPRPSGAEIRHLNGNPLDNRLSNLRYGTKSENMLDAVRHGTHPQASKVLCKRGHPLSAENVYVNGGRRQCRTCKRAVDAASARARRKAKKMESDSGNLV